MKQILILILFVGGSALAAEKATPSKESAHRSTDIRFSGQDVGGKYQSAGEAISTVENEKPLIELIEPRREFKDRLRKSVSQR